MRSWFIKASTMLFGFASVLTLGVYDNLKGGVIQDLADWVRYRWSSPVYILALTDPIEIDVKRITLMPVGGRGEFAKLDHVSLPPSGTEDRRSRHIEITVYPGQYYIQMQRVTATGTQILATQVIALSKPGEPVKVDTSPSQWATIEALTIPPVGGRTQGTRWTLTASDSEAVAATGGRSQAVLRAALGQLGVWEKGGIADQSAIASYWSVTTKADGAPTVNIGDPLYGLWGGPFLAWAVSQAGGTPPSGSAAFRSWDKWGVRIAPNNAKPGMIAIVETGNRQAPTPSGLMVGIFLRAQPDCTEMVTGNLADRVVVTCVRGRVLSYRADSS